MAMIKKKKKNKKKEDEDQVKKEKEKEKEKEKVEIINTDIPIENTNEENNKTNPNDSTNELIKCLKKVQNMETINLWEIHKII